MSAISTLESKISNLQHKLETQNKINKNLSLAKCETERNYLILEDKYKKLLAEQDESFQNLKLSELSLSQTQRKLNEIMKIRYDLENSLHQCNINAQENISRDTEALQKVQDALLIAETALQEKNEALLRERSVKEECDLLASTIGQVMEDAAKRVDRDMEHIKKQYDNRITNLNAIIDNLKSSLEAQKRETQLSEMRSRNLEEQLKATLQTNSQLDSELHIASQTIVGIVNTTYIIIFINFFKITNFI